MSARTILTTASGRGIDLRNPKVSDYLDWDWQAEHLAKAKRYAGATPGVEYSVAEHGARGAKAILERTGDRRLAACFLVHDNPEAPLGDDTTPKKRAYAEEIEAAFGIGAEKVMAIFHLIETRHDAAVHFAAGLEWPLPADLAAKVKHWDLVMFVTEWRDLMQDVAHPDWAPYAGIEPLPERIEPLPWRRAKSAWLGWAHDLLPSLCDRRGSPRGEGHHVMFPPIHHPQTGEG